MGFRGLGIGLALVLVVLGVVVAIFRINSATGSDTVGQSMVERRIAPVGAGAYRPLQLDGGEPYTVREEMVGANPNRAQTRTSLIYFGQLSDLHLVDEESPARAEVVDPLSTSLNLPFGAAWRPWEALEPQVDDAMVRQLNRFVGASPEAAGDGSYQRMAFVLDTGDSADNQQLNEARWARTVLEGGALDPNSGVDKKTYANPLCPRRLVPDAAEAARYTGVQDYNDYDEGPYPQFYDPDRPAGAYAAWPAYPGLMDRAQQPFTAAGLDVPSYVVFGNHDDLVQGSAPASAAFERVATGCLKPLGPVLNPEDPGAVLSSLLNPAGLLATLRTNPKSVMVVPGDPQRRFVSKEQFKHIFENGDQTDGHGFGFIDPAQEAASDGAAGYYSWSPTPAMRFIALDTVADGGTIANSSTGVGSSGNIDDPQFRWLRGQLEAATAADQLVVIFSNHAPEDLSADIPDELAPPCHVAGSALGLDPNVGCDLDPRSSQPIHLEADVVGLLYEFPNVIAWVAGHSHKNVVEPFIDEHGLGEFWCLRVASTADWPQEGRLVQVFDNHDGTLSIFGTILDQAGQAEAPPPGTPAADMSLDDLASVARTMSFNDPQSGAPGGEGEAKDRNVELLIEDPRPLKRG